MGGGSSTHYYDPPESDLEGTSLIQLRIDHIQHAHNVIGTSLQGRFGRYTPVVLMPQASHAQLCCCCLGPWTSIPSGFSAIVTKFGGFIDGDEGEVEGQKTWSPGCHYFGLWYSVDFLVTKQLIIFDTPVRECKTKDNATVSINVMMVFEITDPYTFCYKVGPEKLDEKLRAAQGEALRQMAMETEVSQIQDLVGAKMGGGSQAQEGEAIADTQHIVDEMNQKLKDDGVMIHHFTIKNVKIPKQQAEDSEEKTLFDSKTTYERMKQAYDRLVLNNDEGKQKLREECDNARMAAEQQAEVVKNTATKETAEVVAQTARDIAELEASRQAEVKKVIVDAELEVSKMKSSILAAEREVKSKTEGAAGRLKAEADAFAKTKGTEARLEVAQRLAAGKTALGEAEGEASAAFAARRAHEAEMRRLDILEKVVQKGDVRIATSQENTMSMSQDNHLVTQVAQQGLEAMRAKLAEMTSSSLARLEVTPVQQAM